jgi:ATP-dependent exoDNAse (exonuclease V) alpha subunit
LTSNRLIEINPQFARAVELMEHSKEHLFVTGRAGTGKSTLLQHFRETTKKKIAVLAPTGVAALNVRGQTIHSFFGLKPNATAESIVKAAKFSKNLLMYRSLDAIVIDEISMVRADLLDGVDMFLRAVRRVKLPFGGMQMIFIGDLYQLPPVVINHERDYFKTVYKSPYFFDAHAANDPDFSMQYIELEKIYRQQEKDFIEVLNAVRNNSMTDEHLAKLNTRTTGILSRGKTKDVITLTTTNAAADTLNAERLAKLPGKPMAYSASMKGKFDEKQAPTEEELKLKIGAQVMMLANDSEGRWVNGSIGTVTGLTKDFVKVLLDTGKEWLVEQHTWSMMKYNYAGGELTQEAAGSFTQYPMKLAWAVTIHKAQGKTFDSVSIDFGGGTFAPGQAYVALSRCRTFKGLSLHRPMRARDVIMDPCVIDFVTRVQYGESERKMGMEEKRQILRNCILHRRGIQMTYLRSNDVKVVWDVMPVFVGEMSYKGEKYQGMRALTVEDGVTRAFKLDRILALTEAEFSA